MHRAAFFEKILPVLGSRKPLSRLGDHSDAEICCTTPFQKSGFDFEIRPRLEASCPRGMSANHF